jgi:predicted AlkP superfamily phosphohydrolase/phosphomutase
LPTPDLSTRLLKPYYFTSELFFTPAAKGDFAIEVVELIDNRGVIPTEVEGPPNELFPEESDYLVLPMTLTVADDASYLDIEVSGNKLQMKPGEWSDWLDFTFPYNSLLKMHGQGRFRLMSLEPEVRLYLSPIQFDPHKLPPILDISAPREFAAELADQHGMYKTLGWAVDTNSASDGAIDEQVFMEDARRTADEYEELLFGVLEGEDDWDLLVHYFEFTDRVQHIMFRHFDPDHPMYEPEAGERWGGTILEAYKRMDEIVGGTMERMPEGSTLFIASDHGFTSFRYAVNFNTWLAKNGYIKLEGEAPDRYNLEDLFEKGDFFVNVDWSQTRAYALGFGNIYINLAGREAQGIVQPGAEYDQLLAEIKAGLEEYVDPTTGEKPVRYVFSRDEAYGTYDPLYTPDLFATTVDGYRTGWQDTLGGIGAEVVEVNNRIWSGDHCGVYPELVEGILFSSRKLSPEKPYMGDVMPTLLEAFGVEPPANLDSTSFWQ